jgi:hypothetical protein
MSLNVKIVGADCPVLTTRLDQSGEKWRLYGPTQSEALEDRELCAVWNPLRFPASDCDPSKFRIALFTHRNWPESRVLSLKEDSRSIGLMFSIQALSSNSVALQENKMWNDYGFMALCKLCSGETFCYIRSRTINVGDTYDISEFYEEDSVVAILQQSDRECRSDSEDDFRKYLLDRLPAFVRVGLFLQLNEGSARVRYGSERDEITPDQQYIRLRPFSPEFPESAKSFLIDLLSRIDPYEDHPAFRFFLYYQVFESLLQEMYDEYYVVFGRMAVDPRYGRASAMKDLVEGLQEALSEKKRLGVLVGANRRDGDEFDALRDTCENILRLLLDVPVSTAPLPISAAEPVTTETSAIVTIAAMAAEIAAPVPATAPTAGATASVPAIPTTDMSHAKALYAARNLLFHNFSKVTRSSGELEDLANSMARIICALALEYRKPFVSLPGL